MFRSYQTIDHLMRDGVEIVKDSLNSHQLYREAVRELGYREIGITVLDTEGREIGNYASHNAPTGEITHIIGHFENPGVVVKVKEEILLEILQRAEEIELHPLIALARYASHFHPGRKRDYLQLPKIIKAAWKLLQHH